MPTADLIGYICGEAEENPLLDVDFHHELFSCDPLPSCFEGKALEGSFGGCRRHGVEARAFDYSRIADACLIEKDMKTHLRAQSRAVLVRCRSRIRPLIHWTKTVISRRGGCHRVRMRCGGADVRLFWMRLDQRSRQGWGDGSDRLPEIASCSIAFASGRVAYALLDRFLMTSLRAAWIARSLFGRFPCGCDCRYGGHSKCDPCPGRAFTKRRSLIPIPIS